MWMRHLDLSKDFNLLIKMELCALQAGNRVVQLSSPIKMVKCNTFKRHIKMQMKLLLKQRKEDHHLSQKKNLRTKISSM